VEESIKRIETKNNWLVWLLIGACSLIGSGYFYYGKIKKEQLHIMQIINTLDCVGVKNGNVK